MAIATYAQLVTAATEWLGRENDTTLVARIPDFITLAEAKFNRELRCVQMEKRSTALVNVLSTEPQYISLPADFQTMRRIRLTGVGGKPDLNYRSQAELDEYRYRIGDVTGQPKYFTVFGSEIELCPTPDSAYSMEMVYRAMVPALTSTNTTNWLLTLSPDAYLYGVLLEAAPYMKEDARIQTWALGLKTALDGLAQLSIDIASGSTPLQIRVTSMTP
jgi:hypothetical protein